MTKKVTPSSDDLNAEYSRFKLFNKEVDAKNYLTFTSLPDINFHFGQNAEDVLALQLFNEAREGFYVDVGSFHPRKYSNTFLLHTLFGWRGINIDASQATIEKFYIERPNDTNLNIAIGPESKDLTYYMFNYPARNTLSKEVATQQAAKEGVEVIQEVTVPVLPLKKVLGEHLPKGQRIDLMNIDIEGLDMDALKSNDWSAFRPRVIMVEDHNIRRKGIEHSPTYHYLLQHDYQFISHLSTTSVYLDRRDDLSSKLTRSSRQELRKSLALVEKCTPNIKQRMALLAATNSASSNSNEELLAQLQKENMDLAAKLSGISKKYRAARKEKEEIATHYTELVSSKSWRYTKPLRAVMNILKKPAE